MTLLAVKFWCAIALSISYISISFVSGWSYDRRTFVRDVASFGLIGTSYTGKSNAACLQGDLSPSCIGIYKVPADDPEGMFATPEALQRNAPSLKYVAPIPAPTTPKLAWELVKTQRLAADDIVNVISAGHLEEGGIKVLNLIPRLTVSGRVLVENANTNLLSSPLATLRRQQVQNHYDAAVVAWNDVDILIGQGIRGDLGVSAVAQIRILSELKDAIALLDDFMADFIGTK